MDITDADGHFTLQGILPHGESRQIEFKRVSGKLVNKALESVCAFVNTDGGWLILGIADLKEYSGSERVFGLVENPEAVDEFRRKLATEFRPPLPEVQLFRLPCTLGNGPSKGQLGAVLIVRTPRSPHVHSLVNQGTWMRLDAGNRQMTAAEITELSYRRGDRSATTDPVDVPLALLRTPIWQRFLEGRGLLTGAFVDQLMRIGLAVEQDGAIRPRRAAVLLFAEEPGSLLAAHGARSDIRVMVYDGKAVAHGSVPNLRKEPQTIRGPLIDQIDAAVTVVLGELANGLTLSGSGFRTKHTYPERVVKEALVNAIIHRDYRLNRDIFVRIFDDRIEVESPGSLPGNITPATIAAAGSHSRNPLLAMNLREFSVPPNIDAGEGVKMMFAEMEAARLYPPQYRLDSDAAVESVTVTLLNLERPSVWKEVSAWLDAHGSIGNADVVRIAGVDTLKASKMLGAWRDQGLLWALPGRGKRNMAYTKPNRDDGQAGLLTPLGENNT